MSRDEELLMKAALSARLPWFSPDAEPEYAYRTDPQDLIDRCCCCSRSECIDCISGRKAEHAGNPYGGQNKADINKFADMILNGLTMSQVCSALGIGRSTFYNYKNKLKGAIA